MDDESMGPGEALWLLAALTFILLALGLLSHSIPPATPHEPAALCELREPLTVDGNLYDPAHMTFYLPCRWQKLEQDV